MENVYLVTDTRLGREVALKILPDLSLAKPTVCVVSSRGRAVAALNHPNILALFDIGQHHGTPFLVSELLAGESLRVDLTGACPSARPSSTGCRLRTG